MNVKGFTFLEILVVLAAIGVLASLLVANLLGARKLAQDRLALAYANNVLKAAWAHRTEDPEGTPVGGDCTDGFTAGSYSVPDPGPGVSSCQLTWRDGLPQVEVRSRSGHSFTLP